MPLNIVFRGLKFGLDQNPITKALLPPSGFSRIFISENLGANASMHFSPKMSRSLTCSPWVCRPSGGCVTCCLLEKAEREWGAPPSRAIRTPRIFPCIFCAFLRDSGAGFLPWKSKSLNRCSVVVPLEVPKTEMVSLQLSVDLHGNTGIQNRYAIRVKHPEKPLRKHFRKWRFFWFPSWGTQENLIVSVSSQRLKGESRAVPGAEALFGHDRA